MAQSSPLPPSLVDRPFTVRHALGLGVPYKRLRARDLARPFRGVRTAQRKPGSASQGRASRENQALAAAENQARAFAAKMTRGSYFSHATAAAIWKLPLPWRLERDVRVHVTTPSPDIAVRARGAQGHRTRRRCGTRVVSGLVVCEPVRVWVDLATALSVDELIALGDALVCPVFRADGAVDAGLATMDDLQRAVRGARFRRGVRKLAEALREIRVGAQSPGETRTRLLACRGGAPEPELNGRITDDSENFIARGDLVFRDAKVVVEYEGDHHRVDPATFERDIRRRERLEDAGWRMVRVTKADIGVHHRAFVERLVRLVGVAS